MIISCACGARLKIGDEKLTDAGVKIRCPKCGTVHLARKSAATEAPWPAEAPGRPIMPPVSSARGAGALVLVAHDSKVVADMIDGVLKSAGMSTAHAPNGLEALRMATELKPQAMVVDVGLTGIYGFELCERLKGDPDTKEIKIILLSSVYGLTAYKRAPVNLYGADDYIEKHHIPDKLAPKLQRLIAGGEEGAAVPEKGSPSTAAPAASPTMPSQSVAEQTKIHVPEIPSILPKTPVTLSTSRKRVESPASSAGTAASPSPVQAEVGAQMSAARNPSAGTEHAEPAPAPPLTRGASFVPGLAPAAVEMKEHSAPPEAMPADASVKLDAAFFEHEEYETPVGAASQLAVDPAEIEKAKRFARIIVSDIVLYNQEAVVEGLRQGTFYDLLKDDITEGRAVYAQRVPESVRKHHDYLQEAFDDFLASKKKHR